ncbi:ATP-binding protein [Enterococcus sp.]|uniref:sensor histidine kinase n=1 Tax=Enterococcus sp. TaxID=35783 RepID=UPI0028AA234B|nr:ATP-binding protein [Enterococcus sp.]
MISNTAMINRQPEISEMAHLLSNFYRLSLNHGNSRLTVRKELELTVTYAKIQQKMHHHSFDLHIAIDETTKEYDMINLLLQPFVENAIFHGIDHIEDGRRGVLTLRSYCTEDHLIFEIHDNGPGMSENQLQLITKKTSTHYGIHNVCQRIALYYGVEDALLITSSPKNGTRVRIMLPFHLPKSLNHSLIK